MKSKPPQYAAVNNAAFSGRFSAEGGFGCSSSFTNTSLHQINPVYDNNSNNNNDKQKRTLDPLLASP